MAYGNALVQLEAHLLEKRILLVDDEAELVEMVRAILRAAGFENVSIARSGEEALRAVEAHAFDLFVLDVMMPGIDGFQLLARLRALPATADVPALFLTAKDEPFDRVNGTTAELTAKEHEILSVLARNIGRIVTIDALCEACWGTSFGYENSLMAHIRRLREKIEENPSKPQSLVTVKGLGYKLVAKR